MQHCFDGIRSGDETGVDCSGSCPAKCETGDTCLVDSDCAGADGGDIVCDATTMRCTAPSSCSNGVQDGDEVGVDVGPGCGPTAVGGACTASSQCGSQRCVGYAGAGRAPGQCAPGTCFDSIHTPAIGESDVDCGAGCGAGKLCPLYYRCNSGIDCFS